MKINNVYSIWSIPSMARFPALSNTKRGTPINVAITEFFIYKANSISEAILVHNLHNCGLTSLVYLTLHKTLTLGVINVNAGVQCDFP